jgi:hypothetical protein
VIVLQFAVAVNQNNWHAGEAEASSAGEQLAKEYPG